MVEKGKQERRENRILWNACSRRSPVHSYSILTGGLKATDKVGKWDRDPGRSELVGHSLVERKFDVQEGDRHAAFGTQRNDDVAVCRCVSGLSGLWWICLGEIRTDGRAGEFCCPGILAVYRSAFFRTADSLR